MPGDFWSCDCIGPAGACPCVRKSEEVAAKRQTPPVIGCELTPEESADALRKIADEIERIG